MHYQQEIATRDIESWGLYLLNTSFFGIISTVIRGTSIVSPLFSIMHSSPVAWTMYYLASFTVLVSMVWKIRKVRKLSRPADDLSFSFCIVGMLLISPLTWMHIFPLLVIPFLFLFRSIERSRTIFIITSLALILTCLPDVDLSNWIVAMYSPDRTPYWAYLLTRNGFISLLMLWGLLLATWPKHQNVPTH
jgi:hypothetical protein